MLRGFAHLPRVLTRFGATRNTSHFAVAERPTVVKDLVQNVVESVDGNFIEARRRVEALSQVTLNVKQIHAIIASFLILHEDARCTLLYGVGHDHAYFRNYGAKIPATEFNQLMSISTSHEFHRNCIARSGLINQLDSTLYGLFVSMFMGNGTAAGIATDSVMENQLAQSVEFKNLISSKQLVTMAGSGVSRGIIDRIELTWDGLLDAIRDKINGRARALLIPAWPLNCTAVEKAQLLDQVVKSHLPYVDYRQFVAVIMKPINPENGHRLAVAISDLNLPIATSNYDAILEQTLNRFEVDLSPANVNFSEDHHHHFVYHVHGVWYNSQSVVLSVDDYTNTLDEFRVSMRKLFSPSQNVTRSLLFIGCA